MNANLNTKFPVWCLRLSAVAALIGIILLIIFYSIYLGAGKTNIFGPLNDIAVVIQYVLMLPLVFTFHQKLKVPRLQLSLFSSFIGLLGMIGVIILQNMLIFGFIPFSKQIGIVSIFFFITLGWFLLNRKLDQDHSFLPKSLTLTIFAGLVFGYPIWAWKTANKLSE